MPEPNAVFKKTCQNYLKEIQQIDLQKISGKLGLTTHGDNFLIRCLNREYFISGKELNPIWMQNVWPFWGIFFAKALKLIKAAFCKAAFIKKRKKR
jgi:hypothetical protein